MEEMTEQAVREFTTQSIPLSKITVRENVRKEMDPKSLKELVESIKVNGLLQPILVRSVNEHFEVIAGHRRLKAFGEALGETSLIPSIIIEASDESIEILQLTENIQRADMDPFDEAEAFEKLRNTGDYSIKDIALMLGKTPQYVATRLQLTKLHKAVRKSVSAGKVTLTMALELAKYPSEAQKEAYEHFSDSEGYLHRDLKDIISYMDRNFLSVLGSAMFPLDKKIGVHKPCTECPKRSSQEGLLFSKDMTKNDRCMDRECYEYKAKCQTEVVFNETLTLHKEKTIALGSLGWNEDVREDKAFGKIHASRNYIQFDSMPKAKQKLLEDKALYGVIVTGPEMGKTVKVVREKDTKEKSASSSAETVKQTPDERYFRKVDLNVIFPAFLKKYTLAVKRAFDQKAFGTSEPAQMPMYTLAQACKRNFRLNSLEQILFPADQMGLNKYLDEIVKKDQMASVTSLISLMAICNDISLDKEMCYKYGQGAYSMIKAMIDISDIEKAVDDEFRPIGEDLLSKFRKKNERNPVKPKK